MPITLPPLAMRSSLPNTLATLGKSRRAAILAGGGAIWLVATLGAVVLFCTLDAVWGVPAVLRALGLVFTLSISGLLFHRGVWKPWCESVQPQRIAGLLEEKYPKLNDSVASAVSFLTLPQTGSSSKRFREVAVARANRALQKYDLKELVPTGRAWKWVCVAGVLSLAVAVVSLAFPTHATAAVVRLFNPFGVHPWPTKTQVAIRNAEAYPMRAAIGEPFEIAFTVSGVMPESASVFVQLENGNTFEDSVTIPPGETKPQKPDLTARLDAYRIPRSFKFRIVANDGETGWFSVTLAPPPKLVPREGRPSPQIHARYPAYTELPATTLPDGTGAVEGVHGTFLELTAATDRRIASAVLIPQLDRTTLHAAVGVASLAGCNPIAALGTVRLADDLLADIPVAVSGPDDTFLHAAFTPHLSGLYKLQFTDATGLSGTRLLDFRIEADPEPVVTMERPSLTKDPVVLLPTASVLVQTLAEDRTFAVKNLFVEYRIGGPDGPIRTLPLVDLPSQGSTLSILAGGAAAFNQYKQPSASALASFPLSLFTKADGSAPVDGDRIIIRTAATDFDTVSVLKDPGRSKEEITIQIVSKTTLDITLQQELAKLRAPLLKAREEQRRIRERTEEVAKNATEKTLSAEDANTLGQAERDQRTVRSDLADPRDGLQRAAQLLKDTIKANGIPSNTTTERIDAVVEDLNRVADQNLNPVEPLIAAAKQELDKNGKDAKPDPKKIADDLKKAVRGQTAAEANLDAVLKRLEQWASAGEVRAEARAIKDLVAKAGTEATEATAQVEQGKPAEELKPTEKAELNKAAEKFNRLADRAGATLGKAERLAEENENKAKDLSAKADAKAAEAKAAQAEAGKQPSGSDAAKQAQAQANTLSAKAKDLQVQAGKAKAEAEALRNAVQQAGGQDVQNDLRAAAKELQQNNASNSKAAEQSAMQRLDKFSQALGEKQPDKDEELATKRKQADEIDKLAEEQDELRKKTKAAEKIEDASQREEELKKLSREQEDLQKKTEELVQKLTREREQDAAETLRKAAEKMEQAKEELEQGKPPEEQQKDALDRLDETVKQLDQERQDDQDKLGREKRAQLAEQLKSLRERLKATDEEAARIQADVVKKAGWDRARIASLSDLEGRSNAVAEELAKFAEKELEPVPVFKQLVEQAAVLTEQAGKRFAERKGDALDSIGQPFDAPAEKVADDRTRRPLRTALRRLDHVLDSLKDDPKAPQAGGDAPMPMPMGGGDQPPMPTPMPMGGQPNSGVPPLAQLKALRAIQAELNERTGEFAKAHPDAAKQTEADREELEELERSQREVAGLFEKIKPLFKKPMPTGAPELP